MTLTFAGIFEFSGKIVPLKLVGDKGTAALAQFCSLYALSYHYAQMSTISDSLLSNPQLLSLEYSPL